MRSLPPNITIGLLRYYWMSVIEEIMIRCKAMYTTIHRASQIQAH